MAKSGELGPQSVDVTHCMAVKRGGVCLTVLSANAAPVMMIIDFNALIPDRSDPDNSGEPPVPAGPVHVPVLGHGVGPLIACGGWACC